MERFVELSNILHNLNYYNAMQSFFVGSIFFFALITVAAVRSAKDGEDFSQGNYIYDGIAGIVVCCVTYMILNRI